VTTSRKAPVLPHGLHQTPPETGELETALAAVEQAITTLGQTLTQQDPNAVETAAGALQQAMREAMGRFAQVARRGTMPPALRRRLAMASGQVAAQREALFRATTALDQALDILMPKPDASAAVYGNPGTGSRGTGRVIAAS
jgi:alkylation response protein AidB-like acyl-CoA dehydrogenase